MRTKTDGGKMYGLTGGGRLVEVPRDLGVPDVVVCRRVTDYPPAPLPPTAQIAPCTHCGARIAFNPAGPHQDRPKVCMQCAGVEPLPIEGRT